MILNFILRLSFLVFIGMYFTSCAESGKESVGEKSHEEKLFNYPLIACSLSKKCRSFCDKEFPEVSQNYVDSQCMIGNFECAHAEKQQRWLLTNNISCKQTLRMKRINALDENTWVSAVYESQDHPIIPWEFFN